MGFIVAGMENQMVKKVATWMEAGFYMYWFLEE